jgi:hypothetical protein
MSNEKNNLIVNVENISFSLPKYGVFYRCSYKLDIDLDKMPENIARVKAFMEQMMEIAVNEGIINDNNPLSQAFRGN